MTIVNRSSRPIVAGPVRRRRSSAKKSDWPRAARGHRRESAPERAAAGRRGRRRSRSTRGPRRRGAGAACRRRPTRFQSKTRNVASDICWISAIITPAPMAWTMPAGIRMQSPGLGREAVQERLDLARLDRAGELLAGDAPLQPGVDQAPGLGVRRPPRSRSCRCRWPGDGPGASSGWTCTESVLLGVDELDEQRELVAGADGVAEQLERAVAEQVAEGRSRERAVGDDGDVGAVVGHLPALGVVGSVADRLAQHAPRADGRPRSGVSGSARTGAGASAAARRAGSGRGPGRTGAGGGSRMRASRGLRGGHHAPSSGPLLPGA